MIETLISSKTRIKLLLKFFLNKSTTAYLRSLEGEFGESSNAIRLELNRLEQSGMLSSFMNGNKKMFQANPTHPLFGEIHNIVMKHVGLDKVIQNVVEGLGAVEKVYLSGKFAEGLNSSVIDLIFVGNIDKIYLLKLVDKVESKIGRKLRYIIYQPEEWTEELRVSFSPNPLLLWTAEVPLETA
ncbi:MAG: ArsR family transcriptional regulator [Bacteroidota bacterium]